MYILAVDDEVKILEVLSAYLTHKGHTVRTAQTGTQALSLLDAESFDFVLLDLMLPDITGEEICRKIRETSDVPIIMLTAKSQEKDMLEGLRIGADDYLRKPFSLKELAMRMEVILRRTGKPAAAQRFGALMIDFDAMQLKRDGTQIILTASEWKLLAALVQNAGRVLSREQLIELAFGLDFDAYDRAVDTHIKNLRKKIEPDPHTPRYIKTVHGLGYKFEVTA